MKRDMDLIRDLLLKIEEGQTSFSTEDDDEAAERVSEHLRLLNERGLIKGMFLLDGGVLVSGLEWEGHDFLDAIRDPAVWAKTKSGALAAGGWTMDILKDLAKGLIKKQIEERTGVKL